MEDNYFVIFLSLKIIARILLSHAEQMCILSAVEVNPGSLQRGSVKVSLSFPPTLRPPESWAPDLEVLWPGSFLPHTDRAMPTVSPLPRTMRTWSMVRCPLPPLPTGLIYQSACPVSLTLTPGRGQALASSRAAPVKLHAGCKESCFFYFSSLITSKVHITDKLPGNSNLIRHVHFSGLGAQKMSCTPVFLRQKVY